MKTNKHIQRLADEWKAHDKIIIALDFDDTISPWNFKENADLSEMNFTIDKVKKAKETGAYVIIWTCSDPSRYSFIIDYCKAHGLEIDAINENVVDLGWDNGKKLYANIYIDDRGGLNESLNILQEATYLQRLHLKQKEEEKIKL